MEALPGPERGAALPVALAGYVNFVWPRADGASQPTPAEWEEFEGHFVKRKVSLGTCGRAYGTNCHHEHACVRCALLRPDPAQADRFRDIIDNLGERIAEAEQNSWLGEVEGLRISLAAAEDKLTQIENSSRRTRPVLLELQPPMPSRTKP